MIFKIEDRLRFGIKINKSLFCIALNLRYLCIVIEKK